MKNETKIYLFVKGKGWELFSLSDKAELDKRSISIEDGAMICAGARVGNGAMICAGATICADATVGKGAWVGDGATVCNDATVCAGACVGAGAWVGNGATVCDGALVDKGAAIGNGATVCAGAKFINIRGSQHHVSYWGEDRIDIGCQKMTIKEWVDTFVNVGKSHGYSDAEITEYGTYIEMIAKIHGINNNTAQ